MGDFFKDCGILTISELYYSQGLSTRDIPITCIKILLPLQYLLLFQDSFLCIEKSTAQINQYGIIEKFSKTYIVHKVVV